MILCPHGTHGSANSLAPTDIQALSCEPLSIFEGKDSKKLLPNVDRITHISDPQHSAAATCAQ